MPTRHTRSSHQVRGPRRKLVWCELNQTLTLAAGHTSNLNMLTQFSVAGASTLGVTVMRTILNIQVATFVAAADYLEWGLVVGRLADVGTVTALAGTPELDWSYHDILFPGSSGPDVNVSERFRYDVRSKRKVQELDQVYLWAFLNGSAGTQVLQLFSRTLVALP